MDTYPKPSSKQLLRPIKSNMSASFSQKKIVTSNKAAAVKPFCKVCHDSGKTEAEYTSHFVKSEPGSKGKVVCPTLLNQGCSYCHETGHTVSYCQVLKNKAKVQRVIVFHNKDSVVAVKNATKTKTNGFAALGLLDEEAYKIEAQEEAEYPTLRRTQVEAQTQVRIHALVQAPIMSYASMANKTPINKTTPPAVTKSRAIVTHNLVKKSWADWTDSEDDDEASDCECGHCDF